MENYKEAAELENSELNDDTLEGVNGGFYIYETKEMIDARRKAYDEEQAYQQQLEALKGADGKVKIPTRRPQ